MKRIDGAAKEWLWLLGLSAALTAGAAGCVASGADSSSTSQIELPYSSTTAPLPSGALLISFQEYQDSKAEGFLQPLEYIPLSKLSSSPTLLDASSPATRAQDGIRPTYSFSGRDRNIHRVRTLSQSERTQILSRSRLVSRTPANQRSVYSGIYEGIPAKQRSLLRDTHGIELPTSTEFTAMNSADRQVALANLASNASVISSAMVEQAVSGAASPGPRSCTNDVGTTAASAPSSYCDTPRSDGIVANMNYPQKPYVTCVKDQGIRGICWAFAATSMMESAIAYKHHVFADLSEQHLANQVKLFWWPSNYGDGASGDILATMITNQYREPYEAQWPYNESFNRTEDNTNQIYAHSCDNYAENCSDTAHQGKLVCADSGTERYCGFMGVNNSNSTFAPTGSAELWDENNIDQSISLTTLALNLTLPVEIAFDVTDSFDSAGFDGWVRFNPNSAVSYDRGGHIVHVVGYLSNASVALTLPNAPAGDGGGYFIVKNSWGTCSGDAGYYYVPVGYIKKNALSIEVLNGIE